MKLKHQELYVDTSFETKMQALQNKIKKIREKILIKFNFKDVFWYERKIILFFVKNIF